MHSSRKQIAVFVAGALMLVSIMCVLLWSGYREAIQAAEAKTQDYAAIMETRLDATIRRIDSTLHGLARGIPADALNKDAMSRYGPALDARLEGLLVKFPEVIGLRVFDAQGDMLYTSGRESAPPASGMERDYFRLARDNSPAGLIFSEVITGRTSKRTVVVVAKALRDRQGGFLGVVYAALNVDYFQTMFHALNLGAGGNIAIYRSDNFTQVARWPEARDKLNVPLPRDNPPRAALASGVKTTTSEFIAATDGIRRIYSFHALKEYPFFIGVGVAHDEAVAAWRVRSTAVGLSTLLLLGMLAAVLRRSWRDQEVHSLLAAIVESSHDAIYSRSLNGTIRSWNTGAETMLGYTAAEAIGKPTDIMLPPGHLRMLPQNNEQLLQGKVVALESDRRTKDGQIIHTFSSHSPVRDIVITKVPFIMTPFCINGVTSYEANHLGAQRSLYGDGGIDWAPDCFDCMASAAARDG